MSALRLYLQAGSGVSTPKEGKSGDVSGATALYFHMVTSCSSSFPSTGVSPDTARSASQSEQMRSMVHILHPHPFLQPGSPFRNRQTGAWRLRQHQIQQGDQGNALDGSAGAAQSSCVSCKYRVSHGRALF